MSDFLDQFKPDPEFPDERWIWWTAKPVLVDYIAEFAPFDDEFHGYKIPKKRPFLLNYLLPGVAFQTRRLLFSFFKIGSEAVPLHRRLGVPG
jgi:hypothetical protein